MKMWMQFNVMPRTNVEEMDLPKLTPGERSIISAINPVVTISRQFMANAKLRVENISLVHDSDAMWSRILPRSDLTISYHIGDKRSRKGHVFHQWFDVECLTQFDGAVSCKHVVSDP